jgi:hypothetical protein
MNHRLLTVAGLGAGLALAAAALTWVWSSGGSEPEFSPGGHASGAASAVGMSGLAQVLLDQHGPAAGAGAAHPHPHAHEASGPTAGGGSGSSSPVAAGALAQANLDALPELESPADLAAREALRALGYHIDAKYYKMSLAELRRAAARQDAQALMHLAERYLFALDGRRQDPEFQPGFDYRQAAREALQQALAAGNRHSAAVISESFLTEGRIVEAAAWNLMAQRLGDKLSADWFLGTADYKQMSPEQREKARQMAEQLWAQHQGGKRNP